MKSIMSFGWSFNWWNHNCELKQTEWKFNTQLPCYKVENAFSSNIIFQAKSSKKSHINVLKEYVLQILGVND